MTRTMQRQNGEFFDIMLANKYPTGMKTQEKLKAAITRPIIGVLLEREVTKQMA